jgi:Zn-dependent M28 family amino/carboxypeptidase
VFNGAEESFQDASHSFIVNHELKGSVRAVVNVEGSGSTGPEILYQANAQIMIDAYKKAPYPHGTVLANDLFATGIILSDTDFRIFREYVFNFFHCPPLFLCRCSFLYDVRVSSNLLSPFVDN